MTALLPLLMAYSLVGEAAHEWLGMAMLALFIGHHVLNAGWLKNLPKGRYTAFRILQTALVLLIFLSMLGSMVSGIVMSRHVFGFLHLRVRWAQSAHLFSAYWGFVLMSLHLGLHGAMLLGLFRRNRKTAPSPLRTAALRCLAGFISGVGLCAFVREHLTDYLLLRTHFVMLDLPFAQFLAEYLCIMGLFVCIGYYLGGAVRKLH